MIKNVSNTYKSNCKKDSVKYREYIVIDNKEVDIKGDLSDTAYKDTTFFGKFNLKMLKFETENDINYKKKEFVYYKEVNGEAIKIGTFIVTEVKDSDTFESVNVTAYDYGLKFANPYVTNLDYKNGNITMFQVAQEICANCGVELENTSLPNGTFIVDINQFVNEEQFGDAVCLIALENGMFATINSNDKLEFIFTNETDEIIEDYVELDDKRDTHPITCVLVATSEELESAGAVRKDQSLIDKYGENWLKIYDYAFAYSTEKCEQLIEAIFNQVKGFGYSSFKSEYSFLPYLTLGDKIKFKNKDGKLVDSIILRYETSYDEITFEAPSITSASVEYTLPETTDQKLDKVGIEVNRALKEINLLSQRIKAISNTISGTGVVTLTECNQTPLYKLVITGDDSLLFSNNKLFPSATTYLKSSTLYVNKGTDYEAIYDLKIPALRTLGNVKDEYIMENGKAKLIKRIGLNNNLQKYVLDTPIETDLGEMIINLKEGENTLEMPSFPAFRHTATYLLQNEYTDVFASQAQVTSQINIASDEILIESKSQILESGDELIASINTTSTGKVKIKASDTIALEGTTTVGDKIIFNLDGSITAQDLRLLDGGKVIGGDGLLTSMQFESVGQYNGFQFLGFNYNANNEVYKTSVSTTFNIPENFVVVSAYATLLHTPINFWDFNNTSITGSAKNLKLYKDFSANVDKIYAGFNSGYWIENNNLNGDEITNAFGSATYTPANSQSGTLVSKTSIDIKDYISTGLNTLFVRTTDSTSSTSSNSTDACKKTGCAKLIIQVIGYTNFK